MSLPQTNENTLAKRALHVLIIIVVLAFGACIFYLGYVQLGLGEEYRAKAEANQLRDSEISAERGVIYDRNGKELAKSASQVCAIVLAISAFLPKPTIKRLAPSAKSSIVSTL